MDGITELEDALFRAYIKDTSVFQKSAANRRSKSRKELCDKLKMSHEQIEGWATVFERNVSSSKLVFV